MPSIVEPPRIIPGFSAEQSAALFAQFSPNADAIRAAITPDASTFLYTSRLVARAGQFLRASPGEEDMPLLLPSPDLTLPGDRVTVSLERPAGDLRVSCVPNRTNAAQVTRGTVNGQTRATFTVAGLIVFVSNGATGWITAAEHPAESAALTLAVIQTAGIDGATGATGATGARGQQGAEGEQGQQGDQGFPGRQGDPGAIGPRGLEGEPGADGEPGQRGATGADGAAGTAGATGATGPQGPVQAFAIRCLQEDDAEEPGQFIPMGGGAGTTGATGATGATGGAGPQGATQAFAVLALRDDDVVDEPGVFVPWGWGAALRANPRSGGASAFMDAGDFLSFGLAGPTNGQIRSGDVLFRIHASNQAQFLGDTSLLLSGSSANSTLTLDASGLSVTTASTARIAIDATGAWALAGVAGVAGQVPTSAGPGAPVAWGTPAASSSPARDPLLALLTETLDNPEPESALDLWGWGAALLRNPRSGGAVPVVDSNSFMQWDSATSTKILKIGALGLGEDFSIQATNITTLGIVSTTSVDIRNGGATCAVHIQDDGTNGVTVTAPAGRAVECRAPTGLRLINASGGSSGALRIVEAAARPVAAVAGDGQFWVRSDAPNLPMFTDDTDVACPIKESLCAKNAATVVSALTTVLDCCGTFTIPANTLRVGSRFRFEFTYQFVRGATATVFNLGHFLNVGGVALSVALAANTIAGTYQMRVRGEFTVLTTGAGGTAMAIMQVEGPGTTSAPDVVARYAINLALACNTTIALALSGTAQMNTAIAATTITATGGEIQWLA